MSQYHVDLTLFFSMTSDYLNTFLIQSCARSKYTQNSYKQALNCFRKYVVNVRNTSAMKFKFTDCNYDFIVDYRNWLLDNQHYQPTTVNHRLAVLKSYIQYAANRDVSLQQLLFYIHDVPFLREPKKERDILSENVLSDLFRQPKNSRLGRRDVLILVLLFDTAIRVSELTKIALKDINLTALEPYILIHGKGSKERIVTMSEKTIALLKAYIEEFHDDNESLQTPLFYTKIKGEISGMTTRNVERIVNKYSCQVREKNKDVPDRVYPHMFRRTRATEWYRDNVDIALISKILGHSNIETTKDHYAIPSITQKRKASETGNASEPNEVEQLWPDNEEEFAKICGLV